MSADFDKTAALKSCNRIKEPLGGAMELNQGFYLVIHKQASERHVLRVTPEPEVYPIIFLSAE